jgi:Rrf2 family iron-sulfur cluster assembly transcriptional regulator
LPELAAATGVSLSYLQHLAPDLRRANLISGFKGRGGGYRLAKPVYEISVLDIFLSVVARAGTKANEADDSLVSPRNLQAQDLKDQMEKFQYLLLQKISLADVMTGSLRNLPVFKSMSKILE